MEYTEWPGSLRCAQNYILAKLEVVRVGRFRRLHVRGRWYWYVGRWVVQAHVGCFGSWPLVGTKLYFCIWVSWLLGVLGMIVCAPIVYHISHDIPCKSQHEHGKVVDEGTEPTRLFHVHDLRTTLRSSLRARQQARVEGDNRVEFDEVQLHGDVGQQYLHYRIVTNRGKDCERSMPEHVKPIFRECELLDHPCWTTLASRTCANAHSPGSRRTVRGGCRNAGSPSSGSPRFWSMNACAWRVLPPRYLRASQRHRRGRAAEVHFHSPGRSRHAVGGAHQNRRVRPT